MYKTKTIVVQVIHMNTTITVDIGKNGILISFCNPVGEGSVQQFKPQTKYLH